MSSIKLKHSGGNSVSLNPPSSAPTSSEVAFKLPNADGSNGQYIKTDGSGNLAFATVSIPTVTYGLDFAQWRISTLFSGAADPITNWTETDKNVTLSESSGIFTFPSTGYWEIFIQLYGYKNDDQDNTELHIMTTTNNSSYTTRSQSYTSLNNDDGGNLYTSVAATLIFDVTSTTNCKVKFKTANTSIHWAADSGRSDSYAIFKRLGDT